MLRASDKPIVSGPLPDPHHPGFCLRCEQALFYECDECHLKLDAETAEDGVCPRCGSVRVNGPTCICKNCDCGAD